jgi:glycosyltransferase involved in cell wall biosynthesis
MMRILIIVDCYLPSLKSGARLIHDLGIAFGRQGHDVTILTPSDTITQALEIATENGLRVVRVRTKKIKGISNLFRASREVRLSAILWKHARSYLLSNPMDLIVFYAPTIFFGALVRRLKSHWHCPAYLILRDIFPQWAVDSGILKKGLVWRYFRNKEIEQYGAADFIGVESPANLKYFADNFMNTPYRLEVLYNWADSVRGRLPSTGYRKQFALEGKVVFLYGGNLGIVQDLDNLVRLADRLKAHKHISILLVGEGSEAAKLKKSIAEMNRSNIHILDAVPEEDYMSMLAEADVGLISLDRRLKTHNLTGKLLGYLQSGKPVLASVNPGNDLFDILQRRGAGFCILNGDDEGLCSAALSLANDPELRANMGQNSRKLLAELFSTETAVRQIVQHLPEEQKAVVPASMKRTANTSLSTNET